MSKVQTTLNSFSSLGEYFGRPKIEELKKSQINYAESLSFERD
jgi:hypothetical protein